MLYTKKSLFLSRHPNDSSKSRELLACFDVILDGEGSLLAYQKISKADKPRGFKLYAYTETSLTEELQFTEKETLNFAHEDKDITLPWTGDLPQSYSKAFEGEDIVSGLPELIWDLPGRKVSLIRYHYYSHIAELFARDLDCMPGFIALPLSKQPCPDCSADEFTDFRGYKLLGDMQAALGENVQIPRLPWVSANKENSYKEYSYIEDHFAQLNQVLARGRAICRVGVIHPVESYWLHWGPRESTEAARASIDEKLLLLCYWLSRGLIDFDYIIESLLPDQCELINVSEQLPVGNIKYDAIIVPAMETIRSSTMDRLESFRSHGGKLIFLGPAPSYVNAIPDERGFRLWEQSERLGFDKLEILHSLEELRDVRIRDNSGALSKNLFYQMREETTADTSSVQDNKVTNRWLFICHADKEYNKDIPFCDDYYIQIRGEWQILLFDTINGTNSSIHSEISGSWTFFKKRLWDHDSLLLKLVPADKALHDMPATGTEHLPFAAADNTVLCGTPLRFLEKVPVTLHEPNVLVLDIAEYALDDKPYRAKEEILRLDNILRKELGWPICQGNAAQSDAQSNDPASHTLSLRYTFESELAIKGAELALENAKTAKVTLNKEAAGAVKGWYTDECLGRVKLPDIKAGNNVLELLLPYGKRNDVKACFLLGDFSVKVQGICCTLGEPVKTLGFGDICHQGLPFYGGNLTYHLEMETSGNAAHSSNNVRANGSADVIDDAIIEVSSYRFMLLKAAVDGIDRGIIAYAPYRLVIHRLEAGKHSLDLTGFGCRINTFSQLHNNGAAWSYEYCLLPQGILKSPEVFCYNR